MTSAAAPSAAALPDFVEPLSHGIYAIDTGFHRPRFDAAYLMVSNGRAAFIDTGTNHAVPRLLQTLQALGLSVEAVDAVIPTHVHLDHAGGVGALMQALPHATLWVHDRGARHMVDPTALYQGALAVYGQEEMDRSYGQLIPVEASRVHSTRDETMIEVGGRPLVFIDTPGHAKHHHCIWDAASRGWFTGDTFGLSYREFDHPTNGPWMLPTSTPVQFDPDALCTSVLRLLERQPQWMYLTHYGRVGNVPALAQQLLGLLDDTVKLSEHHRHNTARHDQLKVDLEHLYRKSLTAHGVDTTRVRELLGIDLELNAQGIGVWLDRGQAVRAATTRL